MKIYILRHGQTALNAARVMQGRLNEPLDESGRALAAATGRALRGTRFDCCVSSPLIRAEETARIVLRESGNRVPVLTDERLLEIDFGEMEGKKITEMGAAGRLFFEDPLHFSGFPRGETVREVCARTQAFLKELAAKNDGKTYLVSTHGCAMRAMVNFLFPDPADFWRGHAPYNCSFTVVEAQGGEARLAELDKVYYDPALAVDLYKR